MCGISKKRENFQNIPKRWSSSTGKLYDSQELSMLYPLNDALFSQVLVAGACGAWEVGTQMAALHGEHGTVAFAGGLEFGHPDLRMGSFNRNTEHSRMIISRLAESL